MNMKPAVLLRILIKGAEVRLDNQTYWMKDKVLYYWTTDDPSVEKRCNITLNDFMDKCCKIDSTEFAALISTKVGL